MKCISCGSPLPEGARFCPACGQKQTLLCPHCGAELLSNAKFCINCGTPIVTETPPTPPALKNAAAEPALSALFPAHDISERQLWRKWAVGPERVYFAWGSELLSLSGPLFSALLRGSDPALLQRLRFRAMGWKNPLAFEELHLLPVELESEVQNLCICGHHLIILSLTELISFDLESGRAVKRIAFADPENADYGFMIREDYCRDGRPTPYNLLYTDGTRVFCNSINHLRHLLCFSPDLADCEEGDAGFDCSALLSAERYQGWLYTVIGNALHRFRWGAGGLLSEQLLAAKSISPAFVLKEGALYCLMDRAGEGEALWRLDPESGEGALLAPGQGLAALFSLDGKLMACSDLEMSWYSAYYEIDAESGRAEPVRRWFPPERAWEGNLAGCGFVLEGTDGLRYRPDEEGGEEFRLLRLLDPAVEELKKAR